MFIIFLFVTANESITFFHTGCPLKIYLFVFTYSPRHLKRNYLIKKIFPNISLPFSPGNKTRTVLYSWVIIYLL